MAMLMLFPTSKERTFVISILHFSGRGLARCRTLIRRRTLRTTPRIDATKDESLIQICEIFCWRRTFTTRVGVVRFPNRGDGTRWSIGLCIPFGGRRGTLIINGTGIGSRAYEKLGSVRFRLAVLVTGAVRVAALLASQSFGRRRSGSGRALRCRILICGGTGRGGFRCYL